MEEITGGRGALKTGDAVRSLGRGPGGEVAGGSDETRALVAFADGLLERLKPPDRALSRREGVRALGRAFQLLTGDDPSPHLRRTARACTATRASIARPQSHVLLRFECDVIIDVAVAVA